MVLLPPLSISTFSHLSDITKLTNYFFKTKNSVRDLVLLIVNETEVLVTDADHTLHEVDLVVGTITEDVTDHARL